MTRFASDQVRPFRYLLTEPDSPLQVSVQGTAGRLIFAVNDEEWKFLEPLLSSKPALRDVEQADQIEFWSKVLDYGPGDEIEFVEVEGCDRLLPKDLFDCWPDNARFEYEIWSRERAKYQEWLRLANSVTSELTEPLDWNREIPQEKSLRSLEYELNLSSLNRPYLLKRLHALGVLEENERIEPELTRLGCRKLVRWHRAARQLRWVGQFVDGMLCGPGVLTSSVGLEWFVDGPFLQSRLDPLHHLKFAVHHHIKRTPPAVSSSFVVSMGGLISGAFFYQQGLAGMPQLVRGGEPPPGSKLRKLYAHELTPCWDRLCELSARAIRAGFPRWGGRLAWSVLEQMPEHGQSWIEAGVALDGLGRRTAARACLEKAVACGHAFSTSGELAAIWQSDSGPIPSPGVAFEGWESELERLPAEELTAVALSCELTANVEFRAALNRLARQKRFLSYFLTNDRPEDDPPKTAPRCAR